MKLFLTAIITSVLLLTLPAQDTVKNYYPAGQIESEIPMLNGLREGTAKFYFESGRLKEERDYVNGRVEGIVKVYTEEGNLKEMVMVESGRRQGPTSLYNDEGEYLTDVTYDEGKKVVEPQINYFAVNRNTEQAEEVKSEPKAQPAKKKSSGTELPPGMQEYEVDEDDPAFYMTAEVMPVPVGGWDGLYKRLYYPKRAKDDKIEGTIVIRAFIDKDGEVNKAEIVKGIDKGLDESARLTVYYTRFNPGVIKGKPVKIQMEIPLEFKLK